MPRPVATVDPARFQPLRAWAPVEIRREACLAVRQRSSNCRVCADACPLAALSVVGQRVELVRDCSGCGRCQAACPMGAMVVADFEREPAHGRARDGVLVVDCERGALAFDDDAVALRVPCLGGLSAGRLLALCAEWPDHTVVLANRGDCARCDSGGVDHVAAATLQQVAAWMREAGVPEARLPRIGGPCDAARGAQMPDRHHPASSPMDARGRARRGWLGATAQNRAASAPPSAASFASVVPSPERQLQLDALQRLASRHGGRLPAALFHRVDISRACRGHRVCASGCPTGALVRYRDDAAARMGVAFDATLCVACGHCAAVCPERAITLHRGAGHGATARRPLNGFTPCECVDCGARFALGDGDEQTRCPRCRASARLARSAFQSLFGARPGPQG